MTDSDEHARPRIIVSFEEINIAQQLATLEATWRRVAEEAHRDANGPVLGDDARYFAGYADMADRAVQALRALGEQW